MDGSVRLQERQAFVTPKDFTASGRCSFSYHRSKAARREASGTMARTTKKAAGMGFLLLRIFVPGSVDVAKPSSVRAPARQPLARNKGRSYFVQRPR